MDPKKEEKEKAVIHADADEDVVKPVAGFPQCSPGAPQPIHLRDDYSVVLAYLAEGRAAEGGGGAAGNAAADPDDDTVAIVRFRRCCAVYSGRPNDETLIGHPLYDRGLGFYGAFEVGNSSWIRRLERMAAVHDRHNPRLVEGLHHYILTFHDSTFECVAESFVAEMHSGPGGSLIPRMTELLRP